MPLISQFYGILIYIYKELGGQMRPRAIEVEPLENYILKIKFDNGEIGKFDVKPYMKHKMFKQLKNIEIFNTVKIDGLSISWINGADLCPDELYINRISD